ncbi:MAG: T9SS type A sorting domain-containing protein, partial [Bacteroidota bacterium]
YEASLSSGSLAIDPANSNIIYYGTGEATYSAASYYGRGLLKSTNGGDTWRNYTAGLQSLSYFSRLIIRPHHPNELLAALGNRTTPGVSGGLYRSTDAGATWTLLAIGRADDVIFSPTGDTAYAVGSGIGYRFSTDGGQTFSTSTALSMQTRNHIAVCTSSPNIMYFAHHSSAIGIVVYKSTDAGATFAQVATGTNFNGGQAWYDFYMHVNPFDPNYAYVGSIDVWRTTDGGTSFQNITNGYGGGGVHVDQHNVDFHPTNPDEMFCVNDGGVWKSTNRGTSWQNMNTTLTLTQFYRIASDPSNYRHVLGGTQDNGTQRTMGTINWVAAFGGDGGDVCFQSQDNMKMLGETQNNGVRRSADGGNTWVSAATGLSGTGAWVAPLISHPDSADIFYTARQAVFKTTNAGASWFSISTGTSGTIREMDISKSKASVMYATSGGQVYKSANGGYNFSSVSAGLPTRTITSMHVHPDSENVVLVTFSGFGVGKVYRTSNGGATWNNISGDLPDTPVNDVLIYHPGSATSTYLVATDVGVFISNDYGEKWMELADGLPNTVAIHLDYNEASNKIRVGTHGRGVYETSIVTGVIDFANNQPAEFKLFQNYPNPFNPTTSITYSLPSQSLNRAEGSLPAARLPDGQGQAGAGQPAIGLAGVGSDVSLRVYDILGREVATLVNEYQRPGTYTATWDARNVASGVYYYTLKAGGLQQTRKMVVVR